MLERMLIIGAALVYLVELARALPLWSEDQRASKPLSCDVCMTGWLGISVALGVWIRLSFHDALEVAGSAGLCLCGLQLLRRWRGATSTDLQPPE